MRTFRDYIEYSERYLYRLEGSAINADWFLIPSTILAWSAIESFVNNMLEDFSKVPKELFGIHERALLLEKKIRFIDQGVKIGEFELYGTEYRKLEDKILFLIAKFGEKPKPNVKTETLWQKFKKFKEVRDNLVHPRKSKDVKLTKKEVEAFISTAKEIIQLISNKVWKQKIVF